MSTNAREPREVFEMYTVECIGKARLDLLDDLLDPDYVERTPMTASHTGADGEREIVAAMHSMFADLQIELTNVIAEGDLVAGVVRLSGRHVGAFMGIAPTGRQVTITGLDMARVRDGRIVEHWGAIDLPGLMSQLGGTDAAASAATG